MERGTRRRIERRDTLITREQVGTRTRVIVADTKTGEVLSRHWEEMRQSAGGRPMGGRTPQFYRVWASNWQDVVDKNRLTIYERGLLVTLLRYVGWESNFLVDPDTGRNLSEADLAHKFRMSRTHLRGLMEGLRDKGFVSILSRGSGRANHYLLNSHVVFFGKRVKDGAEHAVFDDGPYEPQVRVRYCEREPDPEEKHFTGAAPSEEGGAV